MVLSMPGNLRWSAGRPVGRVLHVDSANLCVHPSDPEHGQFPTDEVGRVVLLARGAVGYRDDHAPRDEAGRGR